MLTEQGNPKPISDGLFPKRAIRACCNCRRSKTKCDGERPCNACQRRDIPLEKCIDGCPSCRRLRVQCDGGIPCTRCVESGINCYDEATSSSGNSNESTDSSARKTSARTVPEGRVKLACRACRRDNKKCDENRPCTRCILRSEECIHVDRSPRTIKYRCVNCRKDHRKCDDNRPCKSCVEVNIECVDAPRKASTATRVKIACINCRRNKVQCDREWPCRFCVRRGLECPVPPCSCGVPSQGHGPGSLICMHLSGRSSEATSISPDEESKTENSEVSPLLSFNFPGYDDPDASQGPVATATHSRLQEMSEPSDIQMSSDLITDPNYTQIHPSEYPAVANPFEVHSLLSGHRSQQGTLLQMPDCAGKDIVQNGSIGMEVDIADDRHKQEPRGIDGLLPGSTEMETRINQECSSILMNLPSHYQQLTTTGDLSGDLSGVDFGVGSSASDAPAAMDGSSQLLGPVPMSMPLSVSVVVPVAQSGPSQQNASYNANIGGTAVHPLLSLSANYVTSEPMPAQLSLKSYN